MFALTLVLLFIIKLRFPKDKSITQILFKRYGQTGVHSFRRCEKALFRLEKLKLDHRFLIQCKCYQVIPKFLRFKLYRRSLENSKLYKSYQFKLLNKEISTKSRCITKATKEASESLQAIQNSFSFFDFKCIRGWLQNHIEKRLKTIRQTHSRKLNNLSVPTSIKTVDPNAVIFNYSTRILSDQEKRLLSLGLDFGIPCYKIDYFKYFLSFENFFQRLKCFDIYTKFGDHKYLLNCVKQIALKHFHSFKSFKVFSPIFKRNDFNTLKNLAKDETITICRPDKGRGVVLLDRSDYVNKVEQLLNDSSKFSKLDVDPFLLSLRLEDKINRTLKKFKDLNILSENQYNSMFASGTHPGILYGLPKTHKTGIPIRPILSACRTATYHIAKFLVPILNSLTTNEFTLRNSYDFCNKLRALNISSDNYICSFDVQSLFTNVPLEETIKICSDSLFLEQDLIFGMNKSQFTSLLKLATSESVFFFNKQLYKQLDGVAMGSPLGPSLANAFLCHHEEIWLKDCPSEFKPKAYFRYVDDTFLLFDNAEQAPKFLNYLNTKHPNIKFTSDGEKKHSLPFLDVLVHTNDNSFQTSVFRKNTYSGLCINFFSFVPTLFKINSIRTLIQRSYKISSNFKLFHEEVEKLKSIFLANSYPLSLFYSVIKSVLNKQYNNIPAVPNVAKDICYVPFPFYGYLSYKIKNELTQLLEKSFPQINFRFIFTNSFKIGSLFKHKERLPWTMCSMVVYKFSCSSCSEEYVGCTCRQLQCRISEHLGRSARTKMLLNKPPYSAVREHAYNLNHPFSIDNFKIIGRSNNASSLKTLESLYISKIKPSLNDQLQSTPLHIVT